MSDPQPFNVLLFLAQMHQKEKAQPVIPPPEPVYVPQTEATIAIRDGGFHLQDTDGKRWLYEVAEFDPIHIALTDAYVVVTIGDEAAVAFQTGLLQSELEDLNCD